LQEKRDQVVIATKVTAPMGEGPYMQGASRRHILQEVEASLKRLSTDYIDVYQLHYTDPNTPIEETLRTLDNLVQQGQGALHWLLKLCNLASVRAGLDGSDAASGAGGQRAERIQLAESRDRN
jgi:aryl-alcohol dehydrogenase-like predicted oxidoreductase